MSNDGASSLPIEEQIETRPVDGGIYVAYPGPFGLHRWDGAAWQKSAGWTACAEPGAIRRLVDGPTLIPNREEPTSVGAVVEDFLTTELFVRMADGKWVAPSGVKTWRDISYPIVRSYGVR